MPKWLRIVRLKDPLQGCAIFGVVILNHDWSSFWLCWFQIGHIRAMCKDCRPQRNLRAMCKHYRCNLRAMCRTTGLSGNFVRCASTTGRNRTFVRCARMTGRNGIFARCARMTGRNCSPNRLFSCPVAPVKMSTASLNRSSNLLGIRRILRTIVRCLIKTVPKHK